MPKTNIADFNIDINLIGNEFSKNQEHDLNLFQRNSYTLGVLEQNIEFFEGIKTISSQLTSDEKKIALKYCRLEKENARQFLKNWIVGFGMDKVTHGLFSQSTPDSIEVFDASLNIIERAGKVIYYGLKMIGDKTIKSIPTPISTSYIAYSNLNSVKTMLDITKNAMEPINKKCKIEIQKFPTYYKSQLNSK